MEVSQAGRHVPGGEAADIAIPAICDSEKFFSRGFDGGIAKTDGYAAVKVAAWHTFTGRSARDQEGDAISRPSGEG